MSVDEKIDLVVAELGFTCLAVCQWHKNDMPVLLEGRRQGGCGKVRDGHRWKYADLQLLELPALEEHAEPENDQKREGKIPAEGGAVPKKFSVSGLEDGTYSVQIHNVLGWRYDWQGWSFPQFFPGEMEENIFEISRMDGNSLKIDILFHQEGQALMNCLGVNNRFTAFRPEGAG